MSSENRHAALRFYYRKYIINYYQKILDNICCLIFSHVISVNIYGIMSSSASLKYAKLFIAIKIDPSGYF